jgi:hypothetical protein
LTRTSVLPALTGTAVVSVALAGVVSLPLTPLASLTARAEPAAGVAPLTPTTADAAADTVAGARADAGVAAEHARREAAARAEAERVAAEQRAAEERAAAERASRAARDPRSLARALLADRGQADQFGCLDKLWQKESGWRHTAENPRSGAYGIPQSLPASKMAAAGPDWRTNPATQIAWGLQYIADAYGSPCAAWRHSQAVNWY